MQLAWEEATFVRLIDVKNGFAPTFSLKNANDLYKNRQMDSIDIGLLNLKMKVSHAVKYILHYADGGLNLHIN